jgi:salicylate hydroxylase
MIKRDIIIIGAGLGGLATAIALRQDGHSVRILEEVTEFKEVSIPRDLRNPQD